MKKSAQGYLFKRGDIYYLQYNVEGKRKIISLKTKVKKKAEKKRDEILDPISTLKNQDDLMHFTARAKAIYKPNKFYLTILVEEFEKQLIRNNSSQDCIKRYKFRINQLLTWLKDNYKEIDTLAKITDEIAVEYSDWLLDTGLANKTYNETLNALAKVLDTFKSKSELKNNPFRNEVLPRRDKNSVSRKEFSEDETLTILESFKSLQHIKDINELEVLFHIGTWSGMRLKDTCLLKWEDIDLTSNNIYVIPYKTKKHGTRVIIPIHPLLKEMLLKAKQWRINDFVLPNLVERYNKRRTNISKAVKLVLEFNDFDTMQDKTGTNRIYSACLYGFHSLRYTFVSSCAKAGIPATLVQDIVGHKNPAMTKFYTRFDNNYRQQEIKKLSFNILGSNSIKSEIISLLDNANSKTLKKIHSLLITDNKRRAING